jgi:hypothetical protein
VTRDWAPTEKLRQAVDLGVHQFVNEKLRERRLGGYGTVQRDYAAQHLDRLIDDGLIQGADIAPVLDGIVAEAVVDYVRDVARRIGEIYYHLDGVNKTVDSLSLQRFIDDSQQDWIEQETAALLALINPKGTP